MELNELIEKLTAAKTDQEQKFAFIDLYGEIDILLDQKHHDKLSRLLESIANRTETIAPMLVMAGFRSTWLYFEDIPEWFKHLKNVHASFKKMGLNSDKLLLGLMDLPFMGPKEM